MLYRTQLKNKEGKPIKGAVHYSSDLSRPNADDFGREALRKLKTKGATHFLTDCLVFDYWHTKTKWESFIAGSI